MSDVKQPKSPPLLSRLLSGLVLAGVLHCSLFSVVSQAAEQDWWFDVEVILFKRDTTLNDLSEKFVSQPIKAPPRKTLDLLSPYLQPDLSYLQAGLAFCRASSLARQQAEFEQNFAFPAAPAQDNDVINPRGNSAAPEAITPQKSGQTDNFEYQVASNDIFADKVAGASSPDNQDAALSEYSGEDQSLSPTHKQVARDLSIHWVEWQIPAQLPCVYHEQLALLHNPFESSEQLHGLANVDKVPVKIDGLEWHDKGQAFLLPQRELSLRSLFNALKKQNDIQPMLHIGWRQEVKFGENNAQPIRLFAGQNYGKTFLANGHLKSSQNKELHVPYVPLAEQGLHASDEQSASLLAARQFANAELMNAIYTALSDPGPLIINDNLISEQISTELPKAPKQGAGPIPAASEQAEMNEIWQLDGNLKVYLKYVGRTPYLHVASSLDFRQPIFDASLLSTETNPDNVVVMGDQSRQANLLQSVRVDQFKQVISKQLHYFDHPLFGMLVYINRYRWPDASDSQ